MGFYFFNYRIRQPQNKIQRCNCKSLKSMKVYVSLILICIVFAACSKSSPTTQSTTATVNCSVPKTFSSDVFPITSTRCAVSGCHGSGSTNGPGELISYQQIFNARSDIRAAVLSGVMPQGSSLSDAQLSALVCWIDSGAPNN